MRNGDGDVEAGGEFRVEYLPERDWRERFDKDPKGVEIRVERFGEPGEGTEPKIDVEDGIARNSG
jgi:hypothetical protein